VKIAVARGERVHNRNEYRRASAIFTNRCAICGALDTVYKMCYNGGGERTHRLAEKDKICNGNLRQVHSSF